MTESAADPGPDSSLAASLRQAFDRSFEAPPVPAAQGLRDFVGIWVGAENYAVAREDVAGIVPVTRIIRLPGGAASLLGVMGLNGDAVFVHGLGRLLTGAVEDALPRWLLLPASDKSRAFAFERLGAYLRIPGADVSALDEAGRGAVVRAAAMAEGRRRPIICVQALLDSIGA